VNNNVEAEFVKKIKNAKKAQKQPNNYESNVHHLTPKRSNFHNYDEAKERIDTSNDKILS